MSDVSSLYDNPQPNLQATTDRGEPITRRLPELRDAAALVRTDLDAGARR